MVFVNLFIYIVGSNSVDYYELYLLLGYNANLVQ
jgi:hypothetical protein